MRFGFLIVLLSFFTTFAADNVIPKFMAESTFNSAFEYNDQDGAIETSVVVSKKSPKKAFAMSAVLPGAGQFYAGNKWRSILFLTAEATGFAVYMKYNKLGKDLENDYHDYAHAHWSEQEYWNYIAHHNNADPQDIEALRVIEGEQFSHGLHREEDQQYFEMIGKYHQFNWGWDDFRDEHDISITHSYMTQNKLVSTNRDHYETMRDDSNAAFRKATLGTTIIIFNHLLSAMEAAFAVHQQNKPITAHLQVEPKLYNQELYSALTLRLNW